MHLDNCTEKEIQSRPVATDNGKLEGKRKETEAERREETIPRHLNRTRKAKAGRGKGKMKEKL